MCFSPTLCANLPTSYEIILVRGVWVRVKVRVIIRVKVRVRAVVGVGVGVGVPFESSVADEVTLLHALEALRLYALGEIGWMG